jgi:hypothetical protein
MSPEEANKTLEGKVISKLIFDESRGRRSFDIMSIEFTDGTRLNLIGGMDGKVNGSIYYPQDRIEEGIS